MREKTKRLLAIALGVGITGGVLLVASAPSDFFGDVLGLLARATGAASVAIPPLIAGALLYALHPRKWFFWTFLAAVVANTLIQACLDLNRGMFIDHRILFSAVMSLRQFTITFVIIPASFLFFCRFRGKLDYLRTITLWMLGAFVAAYIIYVWAFSAWTQAVVVCLEIPTEILLLLSAWCLAFHQVEQNRPPVDSARVISLTCPRCQSPQQIPAGRGLCSNCRLAISISLNEGVCHHCGYPLRGLTGDKCPECGGSIVLPAAPDASAALFTSPCAKDESTSA